VLDERRLGAAVRRRLVAVEVGLDDDAARAARDEAPEAGGVEHLLEKGGGRCARALRHADAHRLRAGAPARRRRDIADPVAHGQE